LTPRRRSELYRITVGLAAIALFAASVKGLSAGHPDGWLVGMLALAGILALEFPLHASINEKLSVASAVFFAAVLLLPMWQAAALIGGLQAADLCIAAARRTLATHETPPLRAVGINIVFNGGQAYLSALGAGWLLAGGGVSARNGLAGPQDVAVVAAAAVLMYCLNLALVAVAKALMTSRHPLHLFFDTQRIAYVQFASLYVLGAVTAFATVRVVWIPVIAVVPAFLVYHSLRQRVEMRRDGMRVMERMADEVDRRDRYTYNHSQRVAIYSHAIARKLGLSPVDVDLLVLAAKVHDIGKIRIPDSILLKPDRLTDAERRVMETHSRLGFDILKPFSEYAKVLDLVLSHHERYDGKGYPNGVVGRRLMLIAQVIPVADSLDAMTSTRAYRGARSWDAAMEELRRGAGTQWNPQVVDAAIAVLAPRERAEPAPTGAKAVPA
jgi:putative nucleotidyltransferase with HDIG domain